MHHGAQLRTPNFVFFGGILKVKQRCLMRVASVLLVAAQAAVSSRHSPMLDSGVGHERAQIV